MPEAGAVPALDWNLRCGVWLLIVMAAVSALIVAGVAARSARTSSMRPGRTCRGCGYDLRGLEAGTCPECGWNDESWVTRQNLLRQGLSRIDAALVVVIIPLLAALVLGVILMWSPSIQ